MAQTQLRTIFFAVFCISAALWQASESATVSPTPLEPENPCDGVSCQPPRICEVDQQSNQTACVCSTMCPLYDKPICGSDGNTYINMCFLRVAACQSDTTITLVYNGSCEEMACSKKECPKNKECVVDKQGSPKCACSEICPDLVDPVCGSNGVTYNNDCELNVAACKSGTKITEANNGKCDKAHPCDGFSCRAPRTCEIDQQSNQATCVCPSICPYLYDPVCGCNGKTYSNMCLLRVAACESNSRITSVYNGTCEAKACSKKICPKNKECVVDKKGRPKCVCSEICPELYDPVCGSDGVTYGNSCQLKVAACKSGKKITETHNGKCNQGASRRRRHLLS